MAKREPEPPLWALMGTIVGPAASLAIVQNLGTQAVRRNRVGEEESGWRVRSVSARSIMVEKGPEAFSLELPRLPEKDGQPAPEKQQKLGAAFLIQLIDRGVSAFGRLPSVGGDGAAGSGPF